MSIWRQKKVVKSAVKEAKSLCCFDFNGDHKSFHSDWIKAYSLMRKTQKKGEDPDYRYDITEDKTERGTQGVANCEDVHSFESESSKNEFIDYLTSVRQPNIY